MTVGTESVLGAPATRAECSRCGVANAPHEGRCAFCGEPRPDADPASAAAGNRPFAVADLPAWLRDHWIPIVLAAVYALALVLVVILVAEG